MGTTNEDSLDLVQQMRQDIAPGASGWDPGAEETTLRTLASDAQVTLGITPTDPTPTGVRNEVIDAIMREIAPGYHTVTTQQDIEESANAGQINSAIILAESWFIDSIADERT